jgi:hypothetical protein
MNYQSATGLRVFMFTLGAVYARTPDEAMDFAVRHNMFGRKALDEHNQLSLDQQAAYRALGRKS